VEWVTVLIVRIEEGVAKNVAMCKRRSELFAIGRQGFLKMII
jgi:hypothetical protein